jgi:hypothetical protein
VKAVIVLTTLVLCVVGGCMGVWGWGMYQSGERSQAEEKQARITVVDQARAFGDAVVAWSRVGAADDDDLRTMAAYHDVDIHKISRDPAFIVDLESTVPYGVLFGVGRISKCFHLIFFGDNGSAGFDMTESSCVYDWAEPTPSATP